MNGTEKQIKWALEIKATAMTGIDSAVRPEMKNLLNSEIEKRDDAKWWIDHRFAICGPRELMMVIADEMKAGK